MANCYFLFLFSSLHRLSFSFSFLFLHLLFIPFRSFFSSFSSFSFFFSFPIFANFSLLLHLCQTWFSLDAEGKDKENKSISKDRKKKRQQKKRRMARRFLHQPTSCPSQTTGKLVHLGAPIGSLRPLE